MPARNTTYPGVDRIVVLPRDLLNSQAFLSLPTGACYVVLMGFMCRRQVEERKDRRDGTYYEVVNDRTLVFTYSQAADRGLSSDQFRRAIDELLAKGFIRIARTGLGKHRAKTLYGLSDGWRTWHVGDCCGTRTPRAPARPIAAHRDAHTGKFAPLRAAGAGGNGRAD